jgi:mRNA guanylyltransferase
MYCTTDDQNSEIVYLIDRKNDYHWIPQLHFPIPKDEQSFHTNTLIDGELVIDTLPNGSKQAKYLVFDCLVLDGNSLMSRTLDKRLAYFKERIFDPYRKLYETYPEEIQYLPFIMEMKSMQFGYGIEMMFRQILPSLPHGNDGLIFTCRNTEYRHGTDQHILKWKPENENSVDFRLSFDWNLIEPDDVDRADGITEPYPDYDSMPVCNLMVFVGDGNPDAWYATLYLTPAEWERLKALNEPLDDRIVECHMDTQKRWRFMRFRDDKHEANHVTTVSSVMESILDAVTEKDLLAAAKGIRDEWKRRQMMEKEREGRKPPQQQVNGTLKRKAEEQGGRPSPGPNLGE